MRAPHMVHEARQAPERVHGPGHGRSHVAVIILGVAGLVVNVGLLLFAHFIVQPRLIPGEPIVDLDVYEWGAVVSAAALLLGALVAWDRRAERDAQ